MAIEQLRTISDYDDFVGNMAETEPTPELINGRIVVTARPVYEHMLYVGEIHQAIKSFARQHQMIGKALFEFEVLLDAYTLLVPDVAFILENSPSGQFTRKRVIGAPDFVCEIASPSTKQYDAQEKFLAYLRAGVREYWMVDPEAPAGERFTLYERIEPDTTAGMPIFQRIPGYDPAASRLFPGITLDTELL